MKSRSVLFAVGTVIALAATGCSSAASEGTTLEFQTGLSIDAQLMAAFEEASSDYEAANQGVTIDLIPAGTNYEADMKVRLAAGNVPDILWTHGWSLLRYSEFLAPLQDEPWAEHFNPVLSDAMVNDAGEFFAFPVDTDVAGLIYNADVLDQVGVDPADIVTWDDFTDAATLVKAAGIVPIAAAGKDSGAGQLADWLAPGAYTDDELTELAAGRFVDQPYQDLLDLVESWKDQELYNPDYSSASEDDVARALSSGDAAFAFNPNSMVSNATQYNPDVTLGYLPVPSITGDDPYLIGGEYNAYGLSKTGDNLELAKDFLNFLAQPAQAGALASAVGSIPGMTNATSELGALQDSYDRYVADGTVPLKPYFDRVYLPNGMWNTMVTSTDSVITGQSAPSGALTQVKSDFSSLFGQSN
ncbi:ABC transporter substrate-binding protein [Cryobacterium sp. Y11]|jgi:raffinose/stachyose/melibiose transport system substrate-binding protein|uniref:ABC transporter substrate-binding protein n=1 Tax=Cryobacterium sp. Y11 TaxID=2045016 RepID=UPI001304AE33|nr:ABC transporter substrate-binding protein [Cryobacterium sp. Y11]